MTGHPWSQEREAAARAGRRVQQNPPRQTRVNGVAARAPGRCVPQPWHRTPSNTRGPRGASSMRVMTGAAPSDAAMGGLLPNSRNPRVRNAKYRNRGVQRTRSDRATAPCIRNGAPGECGELFQEIEGGKGERSGKASHGDAEASLLPCNSVVSRPRARCSKRPLVDCSEPSMRHEAWGSGGGGRQPQASQPRRLRRPRVAQPGERARTLARRWSGACVRTYARSPVVLPCLPSAPARKICG